MHLKPAVWNCVSPFWQKEELHKHCKWGIMIELECYLPLHLPIFMFVPADSLFLLTLILQLNAEYLF